MKSLENKVFCSFLEEYKLVIRSNLLSITNEIRQRSLKTMGKIRIIECPNIRFPSSYKQRVQS